MQEAIKLYEKSAQLSNSKAMMVLGRLYEHGIGVQEDLQKALAYYDHAALNEEPYAIYKIGMFIELGLHPHLEDRLPNKELAFKYFKESQSKAQADFMDENAFKEAFFKIGQYYQFGFGKQ